MTTELIIHIKNNHPIELQDFANSMMAISQEYQDTQPKDCRLYIKEVKSGSIIATLVAGAGVALPLFEHANTMLEFSKNLINILAYLKDGSSEQKTEVSTKTLTNINKFVEPIAKDNGSVLYINITGDNNSLSINSTEANAIQNRIQREQNHIKNTLNGNYQNVLLYWKQTRQDTKNGYKGIIESLSDKEVRVRFADSTIQSQMVQQHPYKHAYLVDVNVQTVNNKPALYTITHLHELIEI